MPAFIHFYSGMTPADFWALTWSEYQEMDRYRRAVIAAAGKGRG